jgi:hypothetical protein
VGQYNREPGRPLRTDDVVHPSEPLAEHDLEEEEHGAERLVLSGRTHTAASEVRDKGSDVFLSEFSRMTFPVKDNEPANPPDVRLLGPAAVVSYANGLPHAIEEPRGGRHGSTRPACIWRCRSSRRAGPLPKRCTRPANAH